MSMDRSSQHSEPSNVSAMPATVPSTRPHLTTESSSKSSERSAVVLALFGPSVGPCVGDFSTTYNRVNGRLYAATRAILFYSNLFGFERRLCLNLSDIESIEAYRSTSIRINMVDCEDHVFRKFFDRDEVLKLLKELYETELPVSHPNDNNKSETPRLLPITDPEDENSTNTRARFESDLSHPDSNEPDAEESQRPRSQSVPSLKTLLAVQEKTNKLSMDLTSRTRKFRRSMSLRSPASRVAPSVVVPLAGTIEPPVLSENDATDGISAASQISGPGAPPGFDMDKAWAEAKQPYNEVALENIALSCSLEAFMDMFVSHEASFPISMYQEESIHDKNISYSKWKRRQGSADTILFPPLFEREIGFVHPLNNTVGPSQAKTDRQQSFQRFGAMGATLQNITMVQGVPGADCFRVEDRWIVESVDDSSVKLSVYFQVVFTKRTMFKPIIQKNVKAETKKWFHGYAKFLRHALHEDDKKDGRSSPPSPLASSDSETEPMLDEQLIGGYKTSSPRALLSRLLGPGVLLVVCWMVVQLFQLQQSVRTLQDQLVSIHEENKELQSMMKQMLDSKC